jgi:uncharacterized protein YbbK (DUF523 family)
MKPVCIVSACLLGQRCRYDGRSKGNATVQQEVDALHNQGWHIHVACPERHLGTPRPPVTLHGGDGHDVLAGTATARRVHDDADLTEAFVAGARASDHPDAVRAILKARSPSCGTGTTSIDDAPAAGDGIFAALLRDRGVELASEDDLQGA